MKKDEKKQPRKEQKERDTVNQTQKSIGPDERGHYPSVSRFSNYSTALNGLVISGPNGNGTI